MLSNLKLFESNIPNAPCLKQTMEFNRNHKERLDSKMQRSKGYTVNKGVLQETAMKFLYDNMTTDEIIKVLSHYQMLQADDNIDYVTDMIQLEKRIGEILNAKQKNIMANE